MVFYVEISHNNSNALVLLSYHVGLCQYFFSIPGPSLE